MRPTARDGKVGCHLGLQGSKHSSRRSYHNIRFVTQQHPKPTRVNGAKRHVGNAHLFRWFVPPPAILAMVTSSQYFASFLSCSVTCSASSLVGTRITALVACLPSSACTCMFDGDTRNIVHQLQTKRKELDIGDIDTDRFSSSQNSFKNWYAICNGFPASRSCPTQNILSF